jgi:hypothetical protein
MAVTHLLLRRADPGLLAYPIRRGSSRSGSELSLRNLAPDVVLGASAAGPDSLASPRLHAVSPPKVSSELETESFTLLHLGGLINRPVQIVGG